MRLLAGIMSLALLLLVLLPNLDADDKPEPVKVDIKEVEKKESAKKDGKKDLEEKLLQHPALTGRVKRMDANSARDFTIDVPQVDPLKVYQLNMWKMNEMNRILRIPFNQPVQRAQQLALYNFQLARKENTEIYTPKEMDLRAVDGCKVRAMAPPTEFDDKGRLKTFTQKELSALRGNSKLPGYAADFDRLNVGQTVTVYLAKTKDQPRREAGAPKKKNPDDDDAKPEVVLIVIVQEGPTQR
jgi:hypothetical protein